MTPSRGIIRENKERVREYMEQAEGFAVFNLIDQKAMGGVPAPDMIQFHSATKDPAGNYYLSDEFNHCIVVLDPEGKCIRTFGSRGNAPGEFWYPRGIAVVDFEGVLQLIVCDAWNHRIQRFDLDGNFINAFGSIGQDENQFDEPVAVIPGEGGRIWILDRCNHRIKLCSLAGETLSIFGRQMTIEDEARLNDPAETLSQPKETPPIVFGFNYPQAFARGAAGCFVVADTNNNRICVVSEKGEAIRFINLKGSEPPYFFPLSIAVVENNRALVRGVNSSYQIIDLNHPWQMTETPLAFDETLAPQTALVDEHGGNSNIVLFDGRKGVIAKCSIEFREQGLVDEPPRPQKKIDPEKISFEWANSAGGYWFEYLLEASETKQATEQIKSFYATCRDEAKKAANELNEHEGEFLKRLVEYSESKTLLDKAMAEGGEPQKDLEPAISWKQLTLRQDQKRRAERRKVLIQNLGWIIKLFGNLDEEYKKNNFSAEERELTDLLEEECKLRKKDYEKVLSWLKESLRKVDTLNFSAALHACVGLVFLHGHIQYLRKSLALLGIDPGEEPGEMPGAFATVGKNDPVRLAGQTLIILGYICLEWNQFDSAIAIFRHGASLNPLQSDKYLLPLCNVYNQMGDYHSSLSVTDEIARKFPKLPQLYHKRGIALESLFRFKEAGEAYQKGLDLKPYPGLLFAKAKLNETSGKFQEAIDGCRSIIEESSGRNTLYEQSVISIAWSLIYQWRCAEALDYIGANPLSLLHAQGEAIKALILMLEGEYSRALSLLKTPADKNPNLMNINLQLCLCFALAGEYDSRGESIIDKMQKKFRTASQSSAIKHYKTKCLLASQNYTEALKALPVDDPSFSSLPQVYMDLAIAANCLEEPGVMETLSQKIISSAQNIPCWYSYVWTSGIPVDVIDKTFKNISLSLMQAGKTMEYENKRPGLWWHIVKDQSSVTNDRRP